MRLSKNKVNQCLLLVMASFFVSANSNAEPEKLRYVCGTGSSLSACLVVCSWVDDNQSLVSGKEYTLYFESEIILYDQCFGSAVNIRPNDPESSSTLLASDWDSASRTLAVPVGSSGSVSWTYEASGSSNPLVGATPLSQFYSLPILSADGDEDQDGVDNSEDLYPREFLEQSNNDDDYIGDIKDPDDDNDQLDDFKEMLLGTDPLLADTDGDGVNDNEDHFPSDPELQGDIEVLGLPDADDDGIDNVSDAYVLDPSNSDPAGTDTDGDTVADAFDAFPNDVTEWADHDGDGIGDNTDLDSPVRGDPDHDGINSPLDNCPLVSNYVQSDSDGDGIGNACDPDVDGDGYNDDVDQFPLNPNLAGDLDGDKVEELDDNCPGISNYVQSDSDGDGIGNACDPDVDGDGYNDDVDQFPLNPYLAGDLDGDKVEETEDNCPGISNYVQSDSDSDGIGDACDDDIDGDGIINTTDSHPLNPILYSDMDRDLLNNIDDNCDFHWNSPQTDSDLDGLGDACDTDIDGDGVINENDPHPLNPSISVDVDGDNIDDSVDPKISRDFIKYSVGGNHGCAYDRQGIFCWGLNDDGQAQAPRNPGMLSDVAAGRYHSCAIASNAVMCWGNNDYGQTSVPPLSNPVAVSAGYFHSCAVDDNGVTCWGRNHFGQASAPAGLLNVSYIASGPHHNCVINNNQVQCWGLNADGQSDVPAGLVNPYKVVAAYKHTCAMDDNGPHCWGVNDNRINVSGFMDAKDISVTSGHTWLGYDGQIEGAPLGLPIFVSGMPTQMQGAIGAHCFIDDDGLKCEGQNSYDSTLALLRDDDVDNDGIENLLDNCRYLSNYVQSDSDGDGIGNACDPDVDGDGVNDDVDNYPLNPNIW